MKNNKFKGWKTVYDFTFRQATKGAGFKVVTTLITLLIIGIIILVNILSAKPEKKEEIEEGSVSFIQTVYILDNSGLEPTLFDESVVSGSRFVNTEFIRLEDKTREEAIQMAESTGVNAIAVFINALDQEYELEAVIMPGSIITYEEAEALLSLMKLSFESNKLQQAGLSGEQLQVLFKPVITSFEEIGEKTNEITTVIRLIAPMLFSLMLYLMLILYGQTISKSVSTEKTSKLMETLLISVHPYALITGKVLAVTSMALLQFGTWIIAFVVGLFSGNAIAHAIYPEYQNSVVTVINFLKDNIGKTALTLPAFILAIIFFCIGFLYYSVLACLAGCMVSKPEDAASTQAIFQFPVVISWLVCYIGPLMGNDGILKYARYIPFTSPFCVPSDLLTGAIGIFEGVITLIILAVFSFIIIMLSARIYKGLILYTGQKLSLKTIGGILRAKNTN